jgi:hypothetical protein
LLVCQFSQASPGVLRTPCALLASPH